MAVDPACAAPLTAAYLDQLPSGLVSYPAAQMRSDFCRDALREYPALLSGPRVSGRMRTLLERSIAVSPWMPVVHTMAVQHLLCDEIFAGDVDAFGAHARRGLDLLFARPLYRALFFVMSPNLLVMGAHRRWNMFCRGVGFDTLGGDKVSHRGRLQFSPYLFDGLACQVVGVALQSALAAAGAKEVDFVVEDLTAREATLTFYWR